MENKDEFHAMNREQNKTYFSKSFVDKYTGKKKRFSYKVFYDSKEEYLLKDEKTIGVNSTGKRQLKALFLENESRNIQKLIVQQFNSESDTPIKNKLKESSFHGNEVEELYLFLKGIKETKFQNETKLNIKDSDLVEMLLDKTQASSLIENNLEILQQVLNSNVTTKDLINFGYRKNQLEIFYKLLEDKSFFDEYKTEIKTTSNEGVWQKFFEKNTWILGYGLDYVFNSELNDKKLEQITSGSTLNSKGKRTDGLLKSLGAINSLCFCELKLSDDPLLKKIKTPYRGESWQVSESLTGAIAQVQRTVHKAIKELSSKTEIKDESDNITDEVLYLYNPKAFIIIGNLNEFIIDGKVNEMKFSSFEMFRKNLRNIEILTYDELYERAFYICNNKN